MGVASGALLLVLALLDPADDADDAGQDEDGDDHDDHDDDRVVAVVGRGVRRWGVASALNGIDGTWRNRAGGVR